MNLFVQEAPENQNIRNADERRVIRIAGALPASVSAAVVERFRRNQKFVSADRSSEHLRVSDAESVSVATPELPPLPVSAGSDGGHSFGLRSLVLLQKGLPPLPGTPKATNAAAKPHRPADEMVVRPVQQVRTQPLPQASLQPQDHQGLETLVPLEVQPLVSGLKELVEALPEEDYADIKASSHWRVRKLLGLIR